MWAPYLESVALRLDPNTSVSIGDKDVLHLADTLCCLDLHASVALDDRWIGSSIVEVDFNSEVARYGIRWIRETRHCPPYDFICIQVAVCKGIFYRKLGIWVCQSSVCATSRIADHRDGRGRGIRHGHTRWDSHDHDTFTWDGQSRGKFHLVLSVLRTYTICIPNDGCLAICLSWELSCWKATDSDWTDKISYNIGRINGCLDDFESDITDPWNGVSFWIVDIQSESFKNTGIDRRVGDRHLYLEWNVSSQSGRTAILQFKHDCIDSVAYTRLNPRSRNCYLGAINGDYDRVLVRVVDKRHSFASILARVVEDIVLGHCENYVVVLLPQWSDRVVQCHLHILFTIHTDSIGCDCDLSAELLANGHWTACSGRDCSLFDNSVSKFESTDDILLVDCNCDGRSSNWKFKTVLVCARGQGTQRFEIDYL